MARGASDRVLRGLAGQVAGILRRHWRLALPPAAALGAGADAVLLLHRDLLGELLVGVLLAIGFEIYVGYAELIVAADRAPGSPRMRAMLRRAMPLTPALVLSSTVAVTLPLAATGALVIPGLWLATRWSLFAPAIVHEGLGPAAALRRSATLVRGAFWPVAIAVTGSVLIEHAVIHATAHTAEPALGSAALGLVGAAVATAAVSGPAAFTISVVYERLASDVRAGAPLGRVHPRPADAAGSRSAVSATGGSD
jgi:hypothetical protein